MLKYTKETIKITGVVGDDGKPVIDKKTGEKIKFFNLGEKTNWQSFLEPNLQNKIEEAFEKEMKELCYL